MKDGFERIVLEVDDRDNGPRPRKAFYGRWLVSPSEPFEYHDKLYAVAITQKGKLVVYVTHEELPPYLDIYDDLASIPRADLPLDLLDELAERLEQNVVEELSD